MTASMACGCEMVLTDQRSGSTLVVLPCGKHTGRIKWTFVRSRMLEGMVS